MMDVQNSMTDKNMQTETSNKLRIVSMPWKNMLEYNQVYVQLFHAEATWKTRNSALKDLKVWTKRMGDYCPATIQATIEILQALLYDDPSETAMEENKLQALYSYHITRFLNFVTSTVKNHSSSSMYELAGQLQLKSFVVDVRHACCHSTEGPPLNLLRSTSNYCMSWLKQHFWDHNLSEMTEITYKDLLNNDETFLMQMLNLLCPAFDAIVEAVVKGATNIHEAKCQLQESRFQALQRYTSKTQQQTLQENADSLVTEMRMVLKAATFVKKRDLIFLNALLTMQYMFEDVAQNDETEQSKKLLVEITQKFFRLLAAQDLIKPLFLRLLKEMEYDETTLKRCNSCCYWATNIMVGFKLVNVIILNNELNFCVEQVNAGQLSGDLRIKLAISGVDIKTSLIFGTATHKPIPYTFTRDEMKEHAENINVYTAALLKSMLDANGGWLREEQKFKMLQLIESYLPSRYL